MATAEKRARTTGLLQDPDASQMTSLGYSQLSPHPQARIHWINAGIPMLFLLISVLAGLWIDGGGMGRLSENGSALFSLSEWRHVISNSENNVLVLALGGAMSFVLAIILAIFTSHLPSSKVLAAGFTGIKASLLPCVILILAWSLKAACDGVQTHSYLVGLLGDSIPPKLFPALIFLMAGVTAFTTGTSYGTMAILIPTALPLAYSLDGNAYGLITIVSMGAVLDGAILGDHCSPISDTTVMSSIASSCDHVHHVRTQLPYAMIVGITALFLGYLPTAAGVSPLIATLLGTAVFIALFWGIRLYRGVPGSFFAKGKKG